MLKTFDPSGLPLSQDVDINCQCVEISNLPCLLKIATKIHIKQPRFRKIAKELQLFNNITINISNTSLTTGKYRS